MGLLRLLVLPVFLVGALLTSVPASAQVTPLGASAPVAASVLSTVAYDNVNHVYLHIWEQGRDVYGRFIGANGVVLGATFMAAPYKQTFAGRPRVAFGAGKFLLTYASDVHQYDTGSNIFGQFIVYTGSGPYAGTLSGGTIFVSPNSGNGNLIQTPSDVVFNPLTQRFLIAYEEWFGSNREAMVRQFAASNGAAVAAAVNISNGPSDQGATQVAFDWEDNRYFAVYIGTNPQNGGELGAYGRLLDGDTAAPSAQFTLTTGFVLEPAAAFMPEADGFLAVWTAFTPTRDVLGRYVPSASGGALPLPAYGVIASPSLNEGGPALDYDFMSRRMLVGAMSDTLRIDGTVLDAAGRQPVAPFILSTVGAAGGSFYPTIRPAANGIFGMSYIIDYTWSYIDRFQLPLAGTPGPQCCSSQPSFNINPTAWTPLAGGGNLIVAVTASDQGANWFATSGAPAWLTTNVGGGTGNANVTLTATSNPGSSPRSASVVIAGLTVAVTQAGSGDVFNGNFSSGISGWSVFGVPTGALVANVVGGVLEFHRNAAPPGTVGQGAVFQATGQGYGGATPIAADFDLGNSSSVRKRITVLLHDLNFSDLHMCTFWLAANAPMRTYSIRTHTNQAWGNATISFYAATAGQNGGVYRLDNVRVYTTPGQSVERTDCVDPTTPAPLGIPNSSNLLTNGDFSSGLASWGTFGQITQQVTGGVFQFSRPAGTPAGVVLQAANVGLPSHTPLTAVFSLGNSSAVRKRVAVLIHDGDFSDLGACTFWIEPGQSLSSHTLKMFTTKSWTNATFSVYPSTVSTEQWVRLDNVSLTITPSTPLVGTECIEPATGFGPEQPAPFAGPGAGVLPPARNADAAVKTASGVEGSWSAAIAGDETHTFLWRTPIDLRDATSATLLFESLLSDGPSVAAVEVSRDGITWERVAVVPPSGDWTTVAVDLSAYAGEVVYVRFVYAGVAPVAGAAPDAWSIRGVAVETRLPQTPQSRLQPHR